VVLSRLVVTRRCSTMEMPFLARAGGGHWISIPHCRADAY
jgi:hypothetical protein